MTAPVVAAVTLLLPFPPRQLSPNARVERHNRAEFVARYRRNCHDLAASERALWPRKTFPWSRVSMIVTFVLPRYTKYDWDNLIASLKAGQDGIVDARIITDDSIKVIERIGYEVETGAWGIRVRIESLEDAALARVRAGAS